MLNATIRFALRYRFLIVFLSLAALVYGSYSIATMPIDIFPDLDRPRVVILTECPGYAPEDVETLVTFPLESALNGATGVESVRSQSGPGISVIYINFQWGTDIYVNRQIVQERLNAVKLPKDIIPQMAPISSLMGQIMLLGMTYKDGPRGGVLASVEGTNYLGEVVTQGDRATLYLWNSVNSEGKRIANPKEWTLVDVPDKTIVLAWSQAGRTGDAPVGPAPVNRINGIPPQVSYSTELQPAGKGTFVGVESNLRADPVELRERTYKAKLTLGQDKKKTYELEFLDHAHAQMKLRTTAEWVVRLRLLKISGVAQIVAMGGGLKQYQVLVNPKELLRYDVALEEVSTALAKNNINASGGWAEKGDKEQPIRFLGRITPEEIGAVPIKVTAERVITLHQVARVVEAPQIKRGDASVNGSPGVVVLVTKQPHVDTRELSTNIRTALEELESALPANIDINSDLFRMERFINMGVFNVAEALVIGAFLVLIILFLFLLNLRTTFISLTAIPLSLVMTAVAFRLISWWSDTDLSINVMTLGGIAVAMGELVDDAIVDVENIFRRLRENNTLLQPRPALQVVYEASVEVRSAIVFGTIMVILVFLPLFFLSGIEGRLFTPLGVAYIISILSSLVISLTVTPVMAYYLLPQAKATHETRDSPLLRLLKWIASYLIRFSMAVPGLILLATWVVVILCGWLLTTLGTDFLPPFDEGSVQVNVTLRPGSSLKASNEVAAQVDKKFKELQKSTDNPGGFILHFVRRTGRAELDEHVEPVSNTEYILNIDPDTPLHREEILEKLQKELKDMGLGADVETEQPLAHLISHMLSGVTAQIAIRVYGDDLNELQRIAKKIKASIQDVPGIASVVIEAQELTDELHITPKDAAWDQFGVDREHLANFVRTAMYGEVVTQVIENERRFDLLVSLDEPYRNDADTLSKLQIKTPSGTASLGMLADFNPNAAGPNTVNRDNVQRRIVIRINTSGRDLGSVVADIKSRVNQDVQVPEAYFVEYGGQFESQQRATTLISVLAMISAIAMFVVLYMLYPSWRIVLQILNALPTAFIGGVLALYLTGQSLTVASMVGFISLGGIAVRNGILLISHYLHLMKYEGEDFSQKMVLRGSLERLSPVLMTALTAIFGLLPLVVTGHEPGREILYPVATVIFGGLITSTFCEFLVHPGIFWGFSGNDANQLVQSMEPEFGPGEHVA
jgi:CzcA family heavy metal efflux pump